MDIEAIRQVVNVNPQGVRIIMIDGTKYEIHHRDYIWFAPVFGREEAKSPRPATSFWVADRKREEYQLINALLVKSVTPLKAGNGHGEGRKKSA